MRKRIQDQTIYINCLAWGLEMSNKNFLLKHLAYQLYTFLWMTTFSFNIEVLRNAPIQHQPRILQANYCNIKIFNIW